MCVRAGFSLGAKASQRIAVCYTKMLHPNSERNSLKSRKKISHTSLLCYTFALHPHKHVNN